MTRTGQLIGIPQNCRAPSRGVKKPVCWFFPRANGAAARCGRTAIALWVSVRVSCGLRYARKRPLSPFAFIGGEEMCPSFSRMEPLAKLLGLPYAPLTPTLIPLPLPAKVSIHFGDPMIFEGHGDEEDHVVLPMVRQVEAGFKH